MNDILGVDFMRYALATGGCVAVAAGLVGYFVVLRNQVFTTDALGHTAFTGGLGALLLGWDLLVGVFASCVAVALVIGGLGGRARGRDVTVGTVFAWVLGVGVLCLSVYTTARSAGFGGVGVSVLFGSILSITPQQAAVTSAASLATAAVMLAIARPLLLLTVDHDVAVARGVPARALSSLFLVLLAATVAVSVQAVGALLIFALLVTPAATAQRLTARPWAAMALSAAVALASVWGGLVLAYYVDLPPSFFIVALASALYLASGVRVPRALPAVAALLLIATAGCGLAPSPSPSGSGATIEVVAAESSWGSVAEQVAGDAAHVTSIVRSPATDPHDYEPTAADARTFAAARYVIVNGAGYDSWASRLIAANPVPGRRVLTVAGVLGKKAGDNPHFWYSPDYVATVARRIAADLGTVQAGESFLAAGLRDYRNAIDTIRQRHAAAKIGATESMFTYLASALGLEVLTPGGYMAAVAAGSTPGAADKAAAEAQAANRQIDALLFNSQNATPDVNALVAKARAAGVPVVPMTETPPPNATFQGWQTAQLDALLAALGG